MTFTARGLYASSSKERGTGGRGLVRVMLVLGALIALGAVAWAVTLILAFSTTSTSNEASDHSGVTALQIDNRTSGDIRIVASDDDTASVAARLRDNLFSTADNAVQEGETLRIDASCDGSFGGHCKVDYEISVPTGTEVRVDGTSGDVTMDGVGGDVEISQNTGKVELSDTGDATVRTTTGNITLADAEGVAELDSTTGDVAVTGSGESLRVGTSTGNVEAADFEAPEVTVSTSTGNQDLRIGDGTLRADASTGNITVTSTETAGDVSINSTTGDVTVRVPNEAVPVRVDGDSTTGDRSVDVATDPDSDLRLDLTTTTGNVSVLPD